MRTFLALLVAMVATSALAQSAPRPAAPPPPPMPLPGATAPAAAAPTTAAGESISEIESKSQVSTRTEGDETIQEYRVNGKLVMSRVTPKHGRPYVMIDHRGDGTFTRMDPLEPGLRVPQWVIFEF
jgi:hypothetical protein